LTFIDAPTGTIVIGADGTDDNTGERGVSSVLSVRSPGKYTNFDRAKIIARTHVRGLVNEKDEHRWPGAFIGVEIVRN
jgi:hypothetical protein